MVMNWVRRVFSSTWRWHGLSHFAISPSSARYLISQKSIFFATRQRLFAIGQSLQKCQKIRKSKRLKILPETKLFCSKHFNICLNNDSCVIEREKKRKIRTCGALWTTQRSESVKNPSRIRWARPPFTLKF